ncbi:TniB family NTP-binding protein [Streptomyces sp. NPDC017615]|uniref:TniB family NTP-binding protein n=1 Tax=Streptomyces sp. NPDC017615 TaxID=3365003 RepID=UPI0037AD4BD6
MFTAVRRLLLVNRRQQAGARRGLIISGPATTGKTTTMMALGRSFQLADARQHPGQAERRPVLFISVPPAATPKMLVSEFARFLGMPITDRLNQTQITGAVCDLLCELGTQLVLVDDVHLLDTRRRAGAETSDQLKYLGERIPATFVYSAIDVETSSLLSGVRGAQIAGRFKIFRHRPLAYATEQDRATWDDLVRAMEDLLRLRAHRPGTLVRHAAYLHARTAGRIGSLSHLVREAALIALTEGTERITKQLLGEVELDAAAETQARPHRSRRA